jgi:hypothetical protein
MILVSKSRVETSWECRRKEYWRYLYQGTGLQRPGRSFHTEFGNALHSALAAIASGGTILYPGLRETIEELCLATDHTPEAAKQWAMIGEGLIRGYQRTIWPTLQEQYKVVHIELPCAYNLGDDVYFIAKPDLILEDRETGELWYVEYKTTGSKLDDRWLNQWNFAVQVHSGIKAAEQTLGRELAGCRVIGLSKGYKNTYDGSQMSPFAWGWVKEGAPGVVEDQYSYTSIRTKGWQKFATSVLPNYAEWVDNMPDDVLNSQFALTPPIVGRDDLVEKFFEQVKGYAQQQVLSQQEPEIGNHFLYPQTFSACNPPYFSGQKCEFHDICWQSWVEADPLASGLYVPKSEEHRKGFIELLEVK